MACTAEGFTAGTADATTKVLTCTAKETGEKTEEGTATLAITGAVCDAGKDDMGCVEGNQCATYVAVEAKDDVAAVTAGQRCAVVADCANEGVTCGAMQLGASLVAAVALAHLM